MSVLNILEITAETPWEVISMAGFAEMFIAAGSLVFAFVMEMRDICAEMSGVKRADAAAKRF